MLPPSSPRYVTHSLPAHFRYLHEPLSHGDALRWIVGRSRLARRLADRIVYSSGGAFLVTGFRGVGKTTFVHQTLRLIESEKSRYAETTGPFELVDVWLNLARPIEPVQLMHHLVRHLSLRLKECGLLERLDGPLRRDLETAFLRTTFEISGRSSQTEETARTAGLEPKWLGLELLGKIASSYKRATTAEEALKFLPYDERAAEFDIVSLSRRLATEGLPLRRPLVRWWQRLRRSLLPGDHHRVEKAADRVSLRVVFVLDELDKLAALRGTTDGAAPLDEVLETLKTVFTSTAFSFIFIAGKELRERWARDVALGDSIYESVFAGDIYLPCLWDDQSGFLRRFLGTSATPDGDPPPDRLEPVLRYLEYKGRGIPRRLLRELNQHVIWDDGSPVLVLDHEEGRYVRVLAKLQEIASEMLADLVAQPSLFVDAPVFDSQCLTLYYTLDWLIARGRRPFSAEQLQEAALALNLGLRSESRVDSRFAQRLIEVLIERSLIEERSPTATVQYLDEVRAKVEYRLAAWVVKALDALPEVDLRPGREPAEDRPPELETIDRYRVVEKLGEGGFGEVLKVLEPSGLPRALKLLQRALSGDALAVKRFEREIAVLSAFDHPNIVKVHGAGVWNRRPYFVMDYVPGMSLKRILASLRKLEPPFVVALAGVLARTLEYIHERGIVRTDLKPSNVLLSADDGEPKLIDFGIAKPREDVELTRTGMLLGTVGYTSPEELRGADAETGPESDVFSLGVVLYEMLTGEPPFPAPTVAGALFKLLNDDPVPPSRFAPIESALEEIVLHALRKDPADRLTMKGIADRLEALRTPVDLRELLTLARNASIEDAAEERELTVAITRLRPVDPRLPEATGAMAVPAPEPPLPSPAVPGSPEVISAAPPPPTRSGLQPPPEPAVPELIASEDAGERRAAFERLSRANSKAECDVLFDLAERICLFTGDEEVLAVPLDKGRLVLGRSDQADLRSGRSEISRFHAAFSVTPRGVEVEDLGSSNGLVLGGRPISHAQLRNGDTLHIGGFRLRVHVFGSPGVGLPPQSEIASRR